MRICVCSQCFNAHARRSPELFMANCFSHFNPPSRHPRNQAAEQTQLRDYHLFSIQAALNDAHWRRKGRTNYERRAGGPRLRERLNEGSEGAETTNLFGAIGTNAMAGIATLLDAASTWPEARRVAAQ